MSFAQKTNEVELIGRKSICLLYKETAVLLQQSLQAFFKTLLVYFFLSFSHNVPCKLLHIR